MKGPDHTIEPNPDGGFVVKVSDDVAGMVAQDGELPDLWEMWDQNGSLMGRAASQEETASFLAAWFLADEPDWS